MGTPIVVEQPGELIDDFLAIGEVRPPVSVPRWQQCTTRKSKLIHPVSKLVRVVLQRLED